MGMFVVVGGRNDFENRPLALNDLYCLNTSSFIWSKIITIGDIMPNLFNHAACSTDSSIIISGGISNENYRQSDITTIEFEPKKMNILIRKNEARKKPLNILSGQITATLKNDFNNELTVNNYLQIEQE